MKYKKPKIGDRIEMEFYDHLKTEDTDKQSVADHLPCIISIRGLLVNDTKDYYIVEVITCSMVSNNNYFAVIKSTIKRIEVI